jgi:hypothetical protein
MTKQETFDIVAAHLLKQGAKSMVGDDYCAYRGECGMKCAAGALIPDEEYRAEFENQTVCDSQISTLIKELGHDVNLVRRLQRLHDNRDVNEWPQALRALATSEGLAWNHDAAPKAQVTA